MPTYSSALPRKEPIDQTKIDFAPTGAQPNRNEGRAALSGLPLADSPSAAIARWNIEAHLGLLAQPVKRPFRTLNESPARRHSEPTCRLAQSEPPALRIQSDRCRWRAEVCPTDALASGRDRSLATSKLHQPPSDLFSAENLDLPLVLQSRISDSFQVLFYGQASSLCSA